MIFGSELDVMGIISLGMSPAVWWFHMIFVCVRVCSEMDRNGIYMEEQMGKTSTNIDQHRPTIWHQDCSEKLGDPLQMATNTLFSVGLLHSQTDPVFWFNMSTFWRREITINR
jgi:hypothetical protein